MTNVTISVPDYADAAGLTFHSTPDASIRVTQYEGETVILANAAGLTELATRLLALAQDGLPEGFHLHLDDGTVLQRGSVGLVLERK
jgi:hypothetical protein